MATELVSIAELAKEENRALRENIETCKIAYVFANNALSIISTAIVGYAPNRKAFGYYLSQTEVQLGLAILSALRQHKVQVYSNVRHALEHTNLAAFALEHPDFLTETSGTFDETKDTRQKAQKWVGETYPEASKSIEGWKREINKDYAHATIKHAYQTVTFGEGEIILFHKSFMDTHDPLSIKADLIHIGSVATRALWLIGTVNGKAKALMTKDTVNEEIRQTFRLGQAALKDFNAHYKATYEAAPPD